MALTEKQKREIAGAVAEVDDAQIAVWRRMTSAERAQMSLRMIQARIDAGATELQRQYPQLSRNQAVRLFNSRDWPEEYIVTCLQNLAQTKSENDLQDLLTLISVVEADLDPELLHTLAERCRVLDVWHFVQGQKPKEGVL